MQTNNFKVFCLHRYKTDSGEFTPTKREYLTPDLRQEDLETTARLDELLDSIVSSDSALADSAEKHKFPIEGLTRYHFVRLLISLLRDRFFTSAQPPVNQEAVDSLSLAPLLEHFLTSDLLPNCPPPPSQFDLKNILVSTEDGFILDRVLGANQGLILPLFQSISGGLKAATLD